MAATKESAALADLLMTDEDRAVQGRWSRAVREELIDVFIADDPLPDGDVAEVHVSPPGGRHTIVIWKGHSVNAIVTLAQAIVYSYCARHTPAVTAVIRIDSGLRSRFPDGTGSSGVFGTLPQKGRRGKAIEKALRSTAVSVWPGVGNGRLVRAEQYRG